MPLGLEDEDFDFKSGIHAVYHIEHEDRVKEGYKFHVLYMEVKESSTYCVKGVLSFIDSPHQEFIFEAGMLPRAGIVWSILEMSPEYTGHINRYMHRDLEVQSYALYEQHRQQFQLEHA